ncbi:MAG: HAMP domain-containing sensor histidine kinase [Fulvivirga sp.]|nr:HAMP domain-containing sensor histidine kinase [Fulvivirga sp.]
MGRNTIRALVIMAMISIGGIIITQVYWFKRAFDKEAEQFNRDVNTALFNVATQFFEINQAAVPANNPIKQLSTNYYVVMINNEIDANLLEFLLTTEFEKRNISADFEYGIYDCTSDKMVYGSYVSMSDDESGQETADLPKWENQNYYFGVQFPDKASIITDSMEVWVFSSSVLVIVIIFFSYALFIIFRQKRLSEIQRDFINNMTHEFKTPISTIALSTEVLKDPDIVKQPKRLMNYATIIESENTRMKNQVERVLQMASLKREDIALTKEDVAMHDLIQEVVNGLNIPVKEKGGKISLNLEADKDTIKGDYLHLSNMLYNLIDNAIKYNKNKPVVIISTQNDQDRIVVTVEDNGIGIPDEFKNKIFDQFYRVPTGNVHDVKGFGLGLNYVNLVVKAHGGSIRLESAPNAGSRFILTFKNG